MKIFDIETDDTLRSTFQYGDADFPFVVFEDEPGVYTSQCIDWHWHHEVEFAFVTSGTIECCVGAEALTLHAGEGAFLNSCVIHRFESRDGGAMRTIVFSPELVAPRESRVYRQFVEPIVAGGVERIALRGAVEDEELLDLVGFLARTEERGLSCLDVQIEVVALWRRLSALLGDEVGSRRGAADIKKAARLHMMIDFIAASYPEQISLEDIASSAGVGRSEALRCFKSGLNTTPVRFLADYRIDRAKLLLRTTADSVSGIARAVGFCDVSYFCRVFKARCGASPLEYRGRVFRAVGERTPATSHCAVPAVMPNSAMMSTSATPTRFSLKALTNPAP